MFAKWLKGGVKGFLNNVKQNCRIGTVGPPLLYNKAQQQLLQFNPTFVFPVSGDWSQIFYLFYLPVYACWTSAIACYACCLICLVVVYDLPVYACWTCYCLHQVVRRSTWVEGSNHPCCGRFPGSSPITKLIYT